MKHLATIALLVAAVGCNKKEPAPAKPDNRLWEIAFPGDDRETLQTRQDVLLTQVFGAKDEITFADHDDRALEAASERAKRALLEMKPSIRKSLPERERLLVKAPFTTDSGGTEWMWVEVLGWEGTTIRGILENRPHAISKLKAGARVEVEESAVFDYILIRANGTREGNETAEILRAQQAR